MSDDFTRYLDKQMRDKEFARAWSASEARTQVIVSIIKLRKENNLTQSELAKKVGTTQNIILKIERGKMNIGIDFLSRLAQAFGLKIEVRFGV